MMPKPIICKWCGAENQHYSYQCFQKPETKIRKLHKQRAIKKFGKEAMRWQEFRDNVAIPYLDKNFGHHCRLCPETENLDVDHIKSRGAHPELKYQLSNLQYLCRYHHRLKTDHKI